MIAMKEYFYHLSNWQIIICKMCNHVVWLNQIVNHLNNVVHCIKYQETVEIQKVVQMCMDVYQDPSKFEEIC